MSIDYSYSSDLFFDELLRLSSDIVWKNPGLAIKLENQDDRIDVEQYILARQNRLDFESIFQFSEEVLRSFKLSDEEIVLYMDNKYEIPERVRDIYTKKQIAWTIENYVEKNNYFRMLNGLPDIEDTDYFYNTSYPDISDDITPIHELSSGKLYSLESLGYIQKLINENPSKKYLKHLTSRKIDIYKARNSQPYSILWVGESESETLLNDFLTTYNESRTMIMNVFYQKIMESNNDEYVGFVGMMILFQTIMLMHKRFLDADISRDFYDVESLRLVYESYGVPFYSAIPLTYHKRIVKNINILLSHKGSTRVFYDLFDIFDFEDAAIFAYYMIKTRRFGDDGKPLIVKDADGNYNNQAMYDIRFTQVKLYNDPVTEMRDPRNYVRYEDLIRNDEYWINDKDLLDKIFNEEFNYMESKYLGIQTTFNLMKIMYETSYYFKLILDNKEVLSSTSIYNSSIHKNINIFDMVVYTCALISRKYGFEGNIPIDIHEIGAVLGYNFKLDLDKLKSNITKDDYLKDDARLLSLLETMDISNLESVKRVYTNLTSLRKYIVRKMASTDDPDLYWAYHDLYEEIMYSKYTEETFTKMDGTTATSFADMLSDCNENLYHKLESLDETDLNTEITDMLYLIKESCRTLEHIQYADNVNIDHIIEYLFKLLDFFKSAKADLTGYEIVYSLVSSADNILKLMNYVDRIYDDYTEQPIYSIFDELTSMIAWIKDRMALLDKYKLMEEWYFKDHTIISSIIDHLEDKIHKCIEIMYDYTASIDFDDMVIGSRDINLLPADGIQFEDAIIPIYEELKEVLRFIVYDEHEFIDQLEHCIDDMKEMPIKSKFLLTSKIVMIAFATRAGVSEWNLDAELNEIRTKSYTKDFYVLLGGILQIFKERTNIAIDITPDELLKLNINFMKVGQDSYKIDDTKDEDLLLRNIYLLYEDVSKAKLYYIDRLFVNFINYYFEEDIEIKESLSCKDFPWLIIQQLPETEAYIHEIKERSHCYAECMHWDEQLILLKEEKFDEG